MAAPLVLMAAGTVMQMVSQYGANIAQAAQEKANAEFLMEQADLAQDAMLRSEKLANFDYAQKVGQQIGAYAASGVDSGSGSAVNTIGGTLANAVEELHAIRKKGALEIKLARSRGQLAADTAKTLESPTFNLMQAGTTAMSAYVKSEGFGSWNNNRGMEYTYLSGGPGNGIKTTGYGPGKSGSSYWERTSATDMGTFKSTYLGTVGGG